MWYRQRSERSAPHATLAWLSAGIIAGGIVLRAWQLLGRAALWTDEAALANNIVGSLARTAAVRAARSQPGGAGRVPPHREIGDVALRNGRACAASVPVHLRDRFTVSPLARGEPARECIDRSAGARAVCVRPGTHFLRLRSEAVLERRRDRARIAAAGARAGDRDRSPPDAPLRRRPREWSPSGSRSRRCWWKQVSAAALVAFATTSAGRRSRAPIAAVVGAWTVGALAATLVSVHQLAPAEWRFMHCFWADGFWPLSLGHPASWAWPVVRIGNTLGGLLALPKAAAFTGAAFAIVGALAAWRHDRRTAMLIVAPVLVTLVASLAQLYPFKDRLVLFLIPLLLLLAAGGVAATVSLLRSALAGHAAIAAATAALILLDVRALHAAPPVYRREEITPAIESLRRYAYPADRGYVYYGAEPAFTYYAARDRLDAASYLIGGCHRDAPRAYLYELDALRGRARAWVLFAHELPRLRERALMLDYLNAIGFARDSVVATGWDLEGKPTSVDLYLYDLSDPARLSVADAKTFSVPVPPETIDDRLRCQSEAP